MSIKRLSGAGLTTPKSNKLWDQVTFNTGMESIATAVAGADQDFFDFVNIPQQFSHLQLRITGAGAYGPGTGYIESWIGLNTNSTPLPTTGYTHRLFTIGDGGLTANSSSQTTLLSTPWLPYGLDNRFVGSYIIDFLDYTNTSKLSTIRAYGGFDANGSGLFSLHSGYVDLTGGSINAIRISTNSMAFKAGTTCALYGIRGA